MNKACNPFDLENLQITPEQLPVLQAKPEKDSTKEIWDGVPVVITKVSPLRRAKQKKFKLEFYQFPKEVIDQIVKTTGNAQLAVLARIHELWFLNFQRNPVELSSASFKSLGISRTRKMRALGALEKSGQIAVQMRKNRSPLVTLKWKEVRD
jgi:hypothetical protein